MKDLHRCQRAVTPVPVCRHSHPVVYCEKSFTVIPYFFATVLFAWTRQATVSIAMRQLVVDGNPAFCIALLDSHHISKTSYTYRRPILIFSTFIGTFGQCISLTGLENELVVHTNSKCCLARAAWSTGLTEKYATINGVVRNKYERNTLRCVPCPYVSSSPDIWVNWDFLCAKTLASWKWPGQGYSVMSLDSCRFMLAQNASADVSGKGVDGENMGVGSKSDVVGKTDFTRTLW